MTERKHTRIYCLLTEKGTACAETGLCEDHDSSAKRDRVEREAASHLFPSSDCPIPGSWTDCGLNPEMECRICGAQGLGPTFGEIELDAFTKDADGEWPEDTCYLYELSDSQLFEDAQGRLFNRVGHGPAQGSVEIVDDDQTHAYWDVTTRIRKHGEP